MLAKFGRSISEMKRISPPPPPPSPVNPLADAQSDACPYCSVTTLGPSAESDVTPLEYRHPDLHIWPVRYVGYALCMQVLFEADIDDDRKLSASEFSHVITKSPDFITTFHFRI